MTHDRGRWQSVWRDVWRVHGERQFWHDSDRPIRGAFALGTRMRTVNSMTWFMHHGSVSTEYCYIHGAVKPLCSEVRLSRKGSHESGVPWR